MKKKKATVNAQDCLKSMRFWTRWEEAGEEEEEENVMLVIYFLFSSKSIPTQF